MRFVIICGGTKAYEEEHYIPYATLPGFERYSVDGGFDGFGFGFGVAGPGVAVVVPAGGFVGGLVPVPVHI